MLLSGGNHGVAADLHGAVGGFEDDDIELAGFGIFVGKVVTEVRATGLFAVDSGERDGFRNGE